MKFSTRTPLGNKNPIIPFTIKQNTCTPQVIADLSRWLHISYQQISTLINLFASATNRRWQHTCVYLMFKTHFKRITDLFHLFRVQYIIARFSFFENHEKYEIKIIIIVNSFQLGQPEWNRKNAFHWLTWSWLFERISPAWHAVLRLLLPFILKPIKLLDYIIKHCTLRRSPITDIEVSWKKGTTT